MRVLFMGTPEIAAECLATLAASHHTVVGLISQPDRPKGRGHALLPTPTKQRAEALGIPVYQPTTLKDGALLPLLSELCPDALVVVAYGRILPKYVLDFPRYGALNLHVSLLPRYRGAAPMQRAILSGERETGVTVMYMDEGLDTGDILLTEHFPIGPTDDLGSVADTSARLGGPLLVRALDLVEAGTAPRIPQPTEGVSYAPKIEKGEAKLDFSLPAAQLLAKIRALSPAPLALATLPDGRSLKILSAAAGEGMDAFGVPTGKGTPPAAPGTVLASGTKESPGLTVACGDGTVVLLTARPEGKGAMAAADLIRGRYLAVGDALL